MSEVPGFGDFWEIGKDEEASNGNGQGDDAVNDEQPLPAFEPIHAIELVDSSHQVPGEHNPHSTRGVVNTRALCQLVFSIP